MKFATPTVLAMLAALTSAHFTLDFPKARGEFDEDVEGNFCGMSLCYVAGFSRADLFQAARTQSQAETNILSQTVSFPLIRIMKSGQVKPLTSLHYPRELNLLLAGVFLSTDANPTSFDNFSQIVPYFQLSGEGTFCIPLDFSSTNATGLQNNQNVTIQVCISRSCLGS